MARRFGSARNVFFQMTRSMPEWSQILIDAPPNFDFTESCVVSHLEADYYQEPHRA